MPKNSLHSSDRKALIRVQRHVQLYILTFKSTFLTYEVQSPVDLCFGIKDTLKLIFGGSCLHLFLQFLIIVVEWVKRLIIKLGNWSTWGNTNPLEIPTCGVTMLVYVAVHGVDGLLQIRCIYLVYNVYKMYICMYILLAKDIISSSLDPLSCPSPIYKMIRKDLRDNYLLLIFYSYTIIIDNRVPFNANLYLLPFAVVVGICFVLMVVFMVRMFPVFT